VKYTDYLTARAALRDRLDAAYTAMSTAEIDAVVDDGRALDSSVTVRWPLSERAYVEVRGDQIYLTIARARFQEAYMSLDAASPKELEDAVQALRVRDAWRHGQLSDLPAVLPDQNKIAVDLDALPKQIAESVAFQLRARDLQLCRAGCPLAEAETEAFLDDAARNAAQRIVLEAEVAMVPAAEVATTLPDGSSFSDLAKSPEVAAVALEHSIRQAITTERFVASIDDSCPICGR
jgi:hypothetical protein